MPDAGRVASTLAEAKRIADGLQFACRLPDKTPDFFACGGPAAEAYWNYFTPARISSLLAAIEAVLKLADPEKSTGVPPVRIRRAIAAALAGKNGGSRLSVR